MLFFSFLRDVFSCIFVWRVKQATFVDIVQADVIVTMAHGLLNIGTPSPGDCALADTIRKLHQQFPDKPIIPQEPVAIAAPDLPYVAVAKPPKSNMLGSSNMSWNTRTVTGFDADVCRKNGWKKVAFVATPWCQPRTQWELERFGLQCVAVPVPPFRKLFNDPIYTHPLSIYWYGRGGLWRYLLVEGTRGRAHYLSYWLGID